MDILDIDEALKDDSFICLEDKTHDDVSNILQQWKSNNCMLPPYQQEQAYKLNSRTFTRPRKKSAQNLETHFSNASNTNGTSPQAQTRHTQPMLNLEIGGLVTTMHKSFLQDTSPPSSICSSMDVSMERMNNSLITSADFSNINFLQSTQSLDFSAAHNGNGGGEDGFNLADKSTNDGYTLSDMIRDRKALESLTMSGDGTLIKDSQIAQIDDISLALSKTASAYSTMDNSTESVEASNRVPAINGTVVGVNVGGSGVGGDIDAGAIATDRAGIMHQTMLPAINGTVVGVNVGGSGVGGDIDAGAIATDRAGIMHQTMLLSDDVISDTTFDLVENSLCADSLSAADTPCEEPVLNVTHDIGAMGDTQLLGANSTFKKPRPMDETICLAARLNTTFDCQPMTPDGRPDARCETPENVECAVVAGRKFYESTPQPSGAQQQQQKQRQHYTPSMKLVDDVNISPIVASKEQLNATRMLSDTFPQEQIATSKSQSNSKVFAVALPRLESLELIENIESPNGTYNKSATGGASGSGVGGGGCQPRLEQSAADIEMQNVLDLAQAEEELLASNNDQEFEDILEEFSKVELNAEHTKMKKSLETIKKRFNYSARHEANEAAGRLNASAEVKRNELQNSKESLCESASEHRRSFLKDSNNSTSTSNAELKRSVQNLLKDSQDSSTHGLTTSSSSASVLSSSSGERLLSRRSRLYDNFNLSLLSAQSPVRSPLDASYTVQKSDTGVGPNVKNSETEMQANAGELQQQEAGEKTETGLGESKNLQTLYKLAEKRERDRDRFKTKIVKERHATEEVKVPCIDDDNDGELVNDENADDAPQRVSRREYSERNVFNNNKSEVESTAVAAPNTEAPPKAVSKINPNYLTYKKPRDKQPAYNLPEVAPAPGSNEEEYTAVVESAMRSRSRSRPRYISGLQKLSVMKATSAGDLEKTSTAAASALLQPLTRLTNATAVNGSRDARFSRMQPLKAGGGSGGPGELKSPMGTKSKSFHNLSSNFGYSGSSTTSGLPAPKTLAYGLKKPTNSNNALPVQKEAKASNVRGTASAQSANGQQQQANEEAVFKVPRLVSGIRAPGIGGVKRAGLVRPSSGYYSLNVPAKGVVQANDADSDAGRHSPTDSLSSASSRSSVQSAGSGIKAPPTSAPIAKPVATLPSTLTKITTGSTGIPKPSGLRPPTTVKRSGLPKPAASGIARR